MSENILLVSEDKSNLNFLFSEISAIHRFDSVSVVSLLNIKKMLNENINIVFINEKEYFTSEILKTVAVIKRMLPDAIIVLLLSKKYDERFIQDCIKCGVYDFIYSEISKSELNNRLLNLLKLVSSEQKFKIQTVFINNSSLLNSKTGLYTHKALRESYYFLRELSFLKTFSYVILTIDSEVKTRVSMNRLGLNLKKILRQTDIVAQGIGKYYLLLPDTDFDGAVVVLQKIADLMGSDIKLHSGIAVTAVENFEELEKKANDSLKSAVANDELYASFDNLGIDEHLFENHQKEKHFKLFQKVFDKKLKYLIEPIFFRTEKEFQSKFDDLLISQYANKIECVFSLKKGERHSELIIRYDGFAKLNFKIVHKGLDTCENTDNNVSLNTLDEKLLLKYISKLYSEFIVDLS